MASAGEVQLWKASEGKRGIPEAIFLDNVEAACAGQKPTDVVAKLQELYSKYQYMQSSLTAQRASLKTKLPDIVSALETVNHLIERRNKAEECESAEYTYQLCETVWCKASAAPTNVVCLWLGANCMLEYTLEEALELLSTNEKNARENLKSLEEDIAFMRDQITTTEVNIARTHNYGVKQRQDAGQEKSKPALASTANATSFSPPPRTGADSNQEAANASGKAKGVGAYTWKQEKDEVEVSVKVPKGVQKTDVKVTILMDSLKVEHGETVLLEGTLAGKCGPNGSTWTMTGSRVEITLEKASEGVWPSLFES